MGGEVEQICQWKDCRAPALEHAVVGLNVFEAKDDVHISAALYTTQHFDLCQKHLDLARLQYVHLKEYELGKCPKRADHVQ